jgi:chromosome segregation ATPase
MPKIKESSIIKSAYDVLAFALQLKKHPQFENIYVDRNKVNYRRSKWGFEKEERYNLRLALLRHEKKYEQLMHDYDNLTQEYDQLLKRKTGLVHHLDAANNKLKENRKEKGFLKKHLKEVLDKNISIDKRMQRMLKQEENQKQQIEKLKSAKDNLLEQNNYLTDKTRQQKSQINALQKTIDQLRTGTKEHLLEKNPEL